MARQNVKIKPNEKIFADTAAFVALLINRDEFHQSANRIMAELSEKDTKLFVTEMVLIEIANALSAIELRARAVSLIDELQTLPNVEIICRAANFLKARGRFTAKDRIKNGV